MKTLLRRALAGFAVAAVAVAGIPAMAEVISYKAELKGSAEVPPNKTTGSGSISVSYDTADKKLSWKGSYSGLTGPVTAAHFHGPAAIGRNAGVAVGIASGNLPASFEGSVTITDAQAADLAAGRWYFNLHTAGNPAGEIRGQVVK
jgi:CHRD domain